MWGLLRRLRARLKYRHFDRDLSQELEAHRAMAEEQLRARGLTPFDATTVASRTLGNTTYMREDARAVWMARWVEHLVQDVRYACRQVRRRPAYHLGLLLLLAIATVSSTITFGVMYAGLWKPWPVHEPESVVIIRPETGAERRYVTTTLAEFRHIQANVSSLQLAAHLRGGTMLKSPDLDVQVNMVSPSFFSVLRVRPLMGRLLNEQDDRPGAPPVGIISHRLWKLAFAADPTFVGRQVQALGGTVQIVGVLEESFEDVHNMRISLWLPLSARRVTLPPEAAADAPNSVPVSMFGRLAPGVTKESALSELTAASASFRKEAALSTIGFVGYDTRNISAPQTPESIRMAQILTVASLLLLAVVCVNVGGVILARTAGRRRELLLRLSLGASRWRVGRQVLIEVAVVALAAGVVGVLGYRALPGLLNQGRREDLYSVDAAIITIAGIVACLAAATACVSALGLVRRLQVSAMNSGTLTHDKATTRARAWLVGAQVALTALVLASAGLLTRSLAHADRVDTGFAPEGVSVVTIPTQGTRMAERLEHLAASRRAVHTVAPDSAFAEFPPVVSVWREAPIRLTGDDATMYRSINHRIVSAGYFATLRVPVMQGRVFVERATEPEVVVSESAARRLWRDVPAIGQRLHVRDVSHIVVGIVSDVTTRQLGVIEPTIYSECGACGLVVIRDLQAGHVAALQQALRPDEPARPLLITSVVDDIRNGATRETRAMSAVVWSVGFGALLIALIGAAGTAACAVEERRREFGVRMALGASTRQLVTQAMLSINVAALRGMATGLILAVPSVFALRSVVALPIPLDPVALALAAAVIVPALALASAIPMRDVARIDPAETFRQE